MLGEDFLKWFPTEVKLDQKFGAWRGVVVVSVLKFSQIPRNLRIRPRMRSSHLSTNIQNEAKLR